jgi:hypothetical protein
MMIFIKINCIFFIKGPLLIFGHSFQKLGDGPAHSIVKKRKKKKTQKE